jgi:hypothetical protein
MSIRTDSLQLLAEEADALLTRLIRVKSFALHETMVPAAAPSLSAQAAIEHYLSDGRRALWQMVARYRQWLSSPEAYSVPISEAQRRFTFIRLRFNTLLSQFDIFADVMTQRSEHETGIWLAGLDAVAADVLTLPGGYFHPPPVVCYLDRGHGAAIRRARTRLPGGGQNPVAIIRVPRERMIGSGVASSLVHEVGHQGAALLDLVNSFRAALDEMQRGSNGRWDIWRFYERWVSEILADFWSVARVGVGSTLGLMGVVSLPRAFVFRVSLDGPHPIPWVRVKLSRALGEVLFPDPQWRKLARIWEAYYPLSGLDSQIRQLLTTLEKEMPVFVDLLVNHKAASLHGVTLAEAIGAAGRQPERLRAYYEAWQSVPEDMLRAPPSLVFAVIGQARADSKLTSETESRLLAELLTQWALRSTLSASAICAGHGWARGTALAP